MWISHVWLDTITLKWTDYSSLAYGGPWQLSLENYRTRTNTPSPLRIRYNFNAILIVPLSPVTAPVHKWQYNANACNIGHRCKPFQMSSYMLAARIKFPQWSCEMKIRSSAVQARNTRTDEPFHCDWEVLKIIPRVRVKWIYCRVDDAQQSTECYDFSALGRRERGQQEDWNVARHRMWSELVDGVCLFVFPPASVTRRPKSSRPYPPAATWVIRDCFSRWQNKKDN